MRFTLTCILLFSHVSSQREISNTLFYAKNWTSRLTRIYIYEWSNNNLLEGG